MIDDPQNEPNDGPAVADKTDESRRAAMLRLAKYTAPTMLALLLSQKSARAS